MSSARLVIPESSAHKMKSSYWHVEGSGETIKDPMLMWLRDPGMIKKERRQRIADTMREVAYITKHRYIWIRYVSPPPSQEQQDEHWLTLSHRSFDHSRQNTKKHGFKAFKPAHPHVTIYTSNDPSYYHLEGHAYVDYDKYGNINGLANWNELSNLHRGLNPELAIFGQRMVKEHQLPGRPEAPRIPGGCGSQAHHLTARVERLNLNRTEPQLYCC